MSTRISSAALVALLIPTLVSAQYTVEVLHSGAVPSPRSYGWGAGGGQQVGHTNIFLGGPSHALLWSGSSGSFVDLHPAGFSASYAFDADSGKQAGWREDATGMSHATMWSGTAASWQNLHNEKFTATQAYGIGGNQQVGAGIVPPGWSHAVVWNGTPESAVDLHPAGDFDLSQANDTDGTHQVGFARVGSPNKNPHAALWSGTAASFVDLHPSGYFLSEARGVAGAEQVGAVGAPPGIFHAGLWRGSAESFVDLNPGKDWGSQAFATNGVNQVGVAAMIVGPNNAVLWSGTPQSMVNLHDLLPSSYQGVGEESWAMGIDEVGNIVGWAADLDDGGRAKAVLWRPVPEPSSAVAIAILMVLLAIRKREMTRHQRSGHRRRK